MRDLPVLIVGAVLILFNSLTVVGPFVIGKRHGRHSSPACIPFAGPILLTGWVLATHKPWWAVPLVWCSDAGTVLVFISIPKLCWYWWQTCSFTRILALRGSSENQRATLTVHSTGRYHLEKWWNRPQGEHGIVRGGELGNASEMKGSYLLQSDGGGSRKLELMPDGSFQIVDEILPDRTVKYSIANWQFLRE